MEDSKIIDICRREFQKNRILPFLVKDMFDQKFAIPLLTSGRISQRQIQRLQNKIIQIPISYGHNIFYKVDNISKKRDIDWSYYQVMSINTPKGEVHYFDSEPTTILVHEHAIKRYMTRTSIDTHNLALTDIVRSIFRAKGTGLMTIQDVEMRMSLNNGMLLGNTFLDKMTSYYKTFINNDQLKDDQHIVKDILETKRLIDTLK